MLIEPCPFADAAVRFDRERGNISTSVIGHEQRFAGFVDDQVARAASTRIDFVEKRQGASLAVDGVAADKAVLLIVVRSGFRAHFGHSIQKTMLGIGGQKGRVWELCRNAHRLELAGCRVEAEAINSFAGRSSVGADISQVGTGGMERGTGPA